MMEPEELPAQWRDQVAIVSLPEEIDMSNSGAVGERLLQTAAQRPQALVADMTATTFCDSAGVRAVMLAHRQVTAEGGDFRLVISFPAVLRVFSIIGADQLTRIYPKVDDAVAGGGD